MKTNTDLKRASAYLAPDLHEALRKRAFRNHRTVSTELKSILVEALEAEPQAARHAGMTPAEWAYELVGCNFQEPPTWKEVRDVLAGDPRLPKGQAIFHQIAYECWYLFDQAERADK